MVSGPHSRKELGLAGAGVALGTLAVALGTEGGALGRVVSLGWVSLDALSFPLC